MKPLRVLALMHDYMVPPEDTSDFDLATVPWKTEYDVTSTLIEMGHDVHQLGIKDDLGVIRKAIEEDRPHIVFNLLEHFHEVSVFDAHVVGYLELLHQAYTGCNPRGLMLARDKSISKALLASHRVPVPAHIVIPVGRKVRRPKALTFPLIVKSLTQDASIGISQASVVDDDEKLVERVRFIHESIGTDAIVEQYIEGRELYVGILGNVRLTVLPVWELRLRDLPGDAHRIATERVKWNPKYQKKYGIKSGVVKNLPAATLERIQRLCRRVYRTLAMTGYGRIDLRLDADGRIWVLEANPNPQIAFGEDLAESAEHAGLSYSDLLQRIITTGLRWRPGE